MGIKIPWQVWACAGLVILIGLFGWYMDSRGASRIQKRWDQSIARGQVIVADLKGKQGQVTTRIEYVYRDRIKTVYEKGDTITKLVPQFIPSGTCDLPGGFRVLHDAAVAGTIPTAAEGTNAAPVSVADATRTIAKNYTTCKAAIVDLEGLRSWVQEQRQIYLDQCKQQGVVCTPGS